MLDASTHTSAQDPDEEPIVDPGQNIIDAHHHLYDRPAARYLLDDMLRDISVGHAVKASVFIQARANYRETGRQMLKPVGETEFANQVAINCLERTHNSKHVCAGIVGYADLMLGDAVRPVLEAHQIASEERFKGVRMPLTWDKDASLLNPAYPTAFDLMENHTFHRGFAQLASFGLSFDAWLFFHQIPQLTQLARRFPEIPIVLNHCGGVLGVNHYRGQHSEVRRFWLAALTDLAKCDNVMVKLGGLGLPQTGLGSSDANGRFNSQELATIWRPWIEPCIELFSTSRCMFESNYPADKASHTYTTGWNAMKRMTTTASAEEKDNLFQGTAARFYRLQE